MAALPANVTLDGPAGIVCVAIAALYALLMLAKTLLSEGPGPARFDVLVTLLTMAALVFVLVLDDAAVVDDEAVDVAEASAEAVEDRPDVALAAEAPPCAWASAERMRRMRRRAVARKVEVVDMVLGFARLFLCDV